MIRRSIIASKNIFKGEKVSLNNIKFARPGKGMPTNDFYKIDGKFAKRDILAETILKQKMFKK